MNQAGLHLQPIERLFGEPATAPKGFLSGTHRTRSPDETYAAFSPLLPSMGITRIANVTGLDRIGLPVCVAVRPNARSLATAQGKGETASAARVSAMMEAIESWHGERVEGPLVCASWADLRERRAVVDPSLLAVRADATWHPERPIEWIEGEDLLCGGRALVPYETVSTNFVELADRRPIFLKSTNGLASGNHAVEAVLHGLLEVIERDALTLWSLVPEPARKRSQLDLATITECHLRDIIERLIDKGIVLAAWDITSDIGVPTYTCTMVEDPESPHWRPIPAISGHGTHLQPEIALSRAIHEAIQSRVTMISGSRDDMFPRDYRDAGDRAEHARLIAAWHEPAPPIAFGPATLPIGSHLEHDLHTVLRRLSVAGISSAVAVDFSLPGVGVPVAKVVVPGLEPVRTAQYRPGPRARRTLQGQPS